MIHIEGMGLLGSLTGLYLEDKGIDFTWSDIDSNFVAWRASTGVVYPAGDSDSQRGLGTWKQWLKESWLPSGAAVECEYVYHHKNPPHEGKYRPQIDFGDMRLAPSGHAVAVNVPKIVNAARSQFAERRAEQPGQNDFVIRAHGFTDRLLKTMWGWTVPVRLEFPDDLRAATSGRQVAFYSRRNRFQIVYAYPIPGTEWHWSGSSLISQQTAHTLNPEKHYELWKQSWSINFPRVPIVDRKEPIQGWRPRPRPDDNTKVRRDSNGISYPALWHSGVRWAPNVIEEMMTMLP